MKKIILFIVVTVVVAAGLIYAYQEMSQERAREAEGEKPVTAPSRVQRDADGRVILRLDKPTQERIGLQTAVVAAASLNREVRGYGRVLDPARLLALVAEIASAQIARETSSKEWERIKVLAQDQNASVRALDAAEAAVKRDQVALDAAQMSLVATWGQALMQQPDLPAFVRSLATMETALVRVDLPADNWLKEPPAEARVTTAGAETGSIRVRLLGPAPGTDAVAQGQGFLFLGENTTGQLRPGLSVAAYLQLPGDAVAGAIVPAAAVVRAAGRGWVYVQTDKTTFRRQAIQLDWPADSGWFVTSGVGADDRLVVVGAQTLLSEELKTQIQLVD